MSGSEGVRLLGLTAGGCPTLLRPVAFAAEATLGKPFAVTVEMGSDQSAAKPAD